MNMDHRYNIQQPCACISAYAVYTYTKKIPVKYLNASQNKLNLHVSCN